MKFNLVIFIFLSSLIACSKDNKIPECIQDKIDEMVPSSSVQLIAVYKTEINGQDHYWFNTGAVTFDGSESIYDENCNEVCRFCGFCVKAECIDAYPAYGSDKWQEVWKP